MTAVDSTRRRASHLTVLTVPPSPTNPESPASTRARTARNGPLSSIFPLKTTPQRRRTTRARFQPARRTSITRRLPSSTPAALLVNSRVRSRCLSAVWGSPARRWCAARSRWVIWRTCGGEESVSQQRIGRGEGGGGRGERGVQAAEPGTRRRRRRARLHQADLPGLGPRDLPMRTSEDDSGTPRRETEKARGKARTRMLSLSRLAETLLSSASSRSCSSSFCSRAAARHGSSGSPPKKSKRARSSVCVLRTGRARLAQAGKRDGEARAMWVRRRRSGRPARASRTSEAAESALDEPLAR